ncbi:nucleotidyltransferase domain-containing protein [Isoptericola sp. b490]|uniref:nucleotidyltransferase domain-containing protein n=1 Tax=Actinotalea lenta TaxID=3064654 RepID=UPI002712493D|nr:nucleotidyltransferase domain-containing protein [Isoptericola sp. b490]MDO8121870.1 nucleotidyltransferase domain-containing protein [Isoptericola sp. b490]
MTLVAAYRAARHEEGVARLRRALALRAMVASGMSQRLIAEDLGISQPAVSQQLKTARELGAVDLQVLVEAARPVLKDLASARGYSRLAVFGSVARRQAGTDSDVDLLVQAPPGTSSFDFVRFQQLLADVLGRPVDLVEYGGLKPGLDDDIRRDVVEL